MKGAIFIVFTEMLAEHFGEETLKKAIKQSNLPSQGKYHALSYYDHTEMVTLGEKIGELTGRSESELMKSFGYTLFSRLYASHSDLVSFADDAFDLMINMETKVHPKLKALYPDAELPHFDLVHHTAEQLQLVYRSSRHLEDLAHGLMQACLDKFEEHADITRKPFQKGTLKEGTLFTITLKP